MRALTPRPLVAATLALTLLAPPASAQQPQPEVHGAASAPASEPGHFGMTGGEGVGALRPAIPFRLGARNVKDILIDGPIVWLGTSGGVIRYDTTRGAYLTYDNKSGLLSNGVFHLSRDGDELWVGTYGGGLSVLDLRTGNWRNFNIPHGMGDAFVYDALRTRSGDVWIATWSGANRVRGGDMDHFESWDLFTVENTGGGLPNDWVYGLAEGTDGEIWLATEGGLARFLDGEWANWKHADGLGAPYEVVKDQITFSTDPGQMSSHHARQKEEQGLEGIEVAYNPNYVVALAVDRDGSVWAGTWGAGLGHFDGARWETFTVADGLPSNHVFALHVDGAGRLWVGTSRGLALRKNGRFRAFGPEIGLAVESVFSIATDGKSAWVGGYGGVTWFPNGIEAAIAAAEAATR